MGSPECLEFPPDFQNCCTIQSLEEINKVFLECGCTTSSLVVRDRRVFGFSRKTFGNATVRQAQTLQAKAQFVSIAILSARAGVCCAVTRRFPQAGTVESPRRRSNS